MMDYRALLSHSAAMSRDVDESSGGPETTEGRLVFLSREIFDFTTYDTEMDVLLATQALEVGTAITDRTTFAYIADPERYQWFVIMCNMPFFVDKLEWGTSIRGAWWETPIFLESLGLWRTTQQLTEPIAFTRDEWIAFWHAMVAFVKGAHP